MAPNPSAALSVLLAVLLAAGPVPAALAAGTTAHPPKKAAPAVESGWGFLVIKVPEKLVPTYHALLIRASQFKGMKVGETREVVALAPTRMAPAQTVARSKYSVTARSERVKLKLLRMPPAPAARNPHDWSRNQDGGDWELVVAGAQVTAGTSKTLHGCVPEGDARCIDGIVGLASSFVVSATPPPATQPGHGSIGRHTPAHGPAHPPVKATTQTLQDWAFFRTHDEKAIAAAKDAFDKATTAAAQCGDKAFVTIPAYSFAFTADKVGQPLKAAATDAGRLMVFKQGSPAAYKQCPAGAADCASAGAEASVCLPADCPHLLPAPAAKTAGAASTMLKRPLAVTLNGAALAGNASGLAPSPCSDKAASQDPLDKLLDGLFTSKVERMGAAWLATDWDGKTGQAAHDALLAALSDAKKKEDTVKAARAKIQGEVATQVDKGASKLTDLMPKFSVTDDDLLAYLCPLLPQESGSAAQPTNGAKPAMAQLEMANGKTRAAAASGSDVTAAAGSDIANKTPAAAPQSQAPALPFTVTDNIRQKCAVRNANQQNPQPPGFHPGTVPPIVGTQVPCGDQSADKKPCPGDKDTTSAAKDAKAQMMTELKRAAVGGAGGALVLGVFGFIFGGPVGALVMGSVGFAVMAGVTYMNNNPFK